MKLMCLIFVQIIFLFVCSGLKNGITVVSKNKERLRTDREAAVSAEHTDRQVTISGKQRKDNVGNTRKRQLDTKELGVNRPVNHITTTTPSSDKRKTKSIEKKNTDVETLNLRKIKCSSKCQITKCPKFNDLNCTGLIPKEYCGCCSFCKFSTINGSFKTSTTAPPIDRHLNENACNKLVCPEFTECILNIQGIPVCRCPNVYACQGAPKDRICSNEGRSYKNRCFLKIDECIKKQKIGVAYSGDCHVTDDLSLADQQESDKSLKKMTNHEIKRTNKNKKNKTLGKRESGLKRQNQRTHLQGMQENAKVSSLQIFHLEREKPSKRGKSKRKKRF